MQVELGRGRNPDDFHEECAVYYYTDLFGKTVLRVERSHWVEGIDLVIKPSVALPNGEWEDSPRKIPEVLYNLQDVVNADSVVITESELAAKAATKALTGAPGVWAATCWPLALGDWPSSCSQYLVNKQVFLVPEDVYSSRYRLAGAANALVGVAASVKMVTHPEFGSGVDFAAFIDQSATPAAELLEAFETAMVWAPEDEFVITTASELMENSDVERQWLVEGLLPAGGIGLLVGDPKIGKSTLARQLAVAVADGKEFLGRKVAPGGALYIAMEGSRSEIKEHLGKLELQNAEMVFISKANMLSPAQLAKIIKERAVSLVIFDTP
jgi:hypothetical protein